MSQNPEEDALLFEAISALAPVIFRPEIPKKQCDCSKQIEALTGRMEEARTPPRQLAMIMGGSAFAGGLAAAGIASILRRKRK